MIPIESCLAGMEELKVWMTMVILMLVLLSVVLMKDMDEGNQRD